MSQSASRPDVRSAGGAKALTDIHVEFEDSPRGGHVATVCYDNAEKLNAIDGAGADALSAAIREAGESPEVRVIVLHGAGERAFIGGRTSGPWLN